MQMWQLGSCFPLSLFFTFIASLNILIFTRRPATLSIAQADFLDLCEQKVLDIKTLADGGTLLNKRQCLDLSTKLSEAFHSIRELALHGGASSTIFRPALESLYRILEKAKSLVADCCNEDWCASSVFQIQNERAFQEVLLDLGLCYNAIYEQASKLSPNFELEDLRGSSTFHHASAADIDEDHETLQRRLSELARQPRSTGLSVLNCLLPRSKCFKQHLAEYLLNSASHGNQKSGAFLWNGAMEPSGTWGDQSFLGRGAGAYGVMSTKWLGISCAKKVFPGRIDEKLFSNEAKILADLNHPGVVKFFCCGSCGDQKDDCFIAMELMDMSLDYLIKERKEPFPLPVAIDIIMQIARGMCYLHEMKVAHRDLKPLNVVVNKLKYPDLDDEYYCVKLVDFGMSKTKVEVHKMNTISIRGVGTTVYRAPEVFPNAHPNGEKLKAMWFKADVYSFAVSCAHILTLERPYADIPNSALYDELINGRRPELKDCPPDLVSLLNACWHRNPSERPPFKAICAKLEDFSLKVFQMMMGEPFSVQTPKTDDNGVEEIQTLEEVGKSSSSTPILSGDSKEVEPLHEDAHTGKLAKVASGTKSRRKWKYKAGAENLQSKKTQTKKTMTPAIAIPLQCNGNGAGSENPQMKKTQMKKMMTPEIAIPQQGNGNGAGSENPQMKKTQMKKMMTPEIAIPQQGKGSGEWRKAFKGKKLNLESVQSEPLLKLSGGKPIKRKQTLEDSPPQKNEVPVTAEKKKRRRKEKFGEGPKMTEDANLPELITGTVSLDRVAFEPVRHFWNDDDEEEITVVYRRPAVPNMNKSRVRRRKNSGIRPTNLEYSH